MSYILFVIGTRPELIKVAPVVNFLRLNYPKLPHVVLNTAQHKDLLDPYWSIFNLAPDHTLDFMVPNQNLSSLTSRALVQLQEFIDAQENKPSVVFAQGDTTSVMVASLVAFYNQIPFAHLEAGLRTYDYLNPFPEELNRRITGLVTQFHFAPTAVAESNLAKEGVSPSHIYKVGNTVVDALHYITRKKEFEALEFKSPELNFLSDKSYVVITCHRRENQGQNLCNIIEAVTMLATEYKQYSFVWLLHPNPKVKEAVQNSVIPDLDNIILTNPLDYLELLKLISKSKLIITDSGGIQEEAPSFSKPVIVLREKSERPESVDKGYSFLVGADVSKIIDTFHMLVNTSLTFGVNPYGDGKASERIVRVLNSFLS